MNELSVIYNEVISDVIENLKQQFIDEGVPLSALEELRATWAAKLRRDCQVEQGFYAGGAELYAPFMNMSGCIYFPTPNCADFAAGQSDSQGSGAPIPGGVKRKMNQTDGAEASSSEDETYESSSSAAEDGNAESGTPLNSDDDVTDQEESFDTSNIIVCQYEKIGRRMNKWKLSLKSGIMNLEGKEYLFKTLVGDVQW